jgi:hypothetical protein
MIRFLRSFAGAVGIVVIAAGTLGVIAWTLMSVVTVTTRNETSKVASNIAVGFTGKTLWRGDLPSGESKWTFGIPREDGTVGVSYEIAGQPFKIECGYVTGGPWGGRYEIIVEADGKHECKDR